MEGRKWNSTFLMGMNLPHKKIINWIKGIPPYRFVLAAVFLGIAMLSLIGAASYPDNQLLLGMLVNISSTALFFSVTVLFIDVFIAKKNEESLLTIRQQMASELIPIFDSIESKLTFVFKPRAEFPDLHGMTDFDDFSSKLQDYYEKSFIEADYLNDEIVANANFFNQFVEGSRIDVIALTTLLSDYDDIMTTETKRLVIMLKRSTSNLVSPLVAGAVGDPVNKNAVISLRLTCMGIQSQIGLLKKELSNVR